MPSHITETILPYGPETAQFGELFRPVGTPRGVVVVIHGGFWHERYTLSLGRPLAQDLAVNGWIAWNLEYRRIENGGGWPTTFDDIAAGIDKLADVPDLPTSRVIALGHSAGGHLALWACARTAFTGAWASPKVAVTAAISQAGVANLKSAVADGLGAGAAQSFMGGGIDDRYLTADPTLQIPLQVPIWCVHAPDDADVPFSQSVDYVAAAQSAGARAHLVKVGGGHYGLIDPHSAAWAAILKILERL
jgi:acetyl esterase/lipase